VKFGKENLCGKFESIEEKKGKIEIQNYTHKERKSENKSWDLVRRKKKGFSNHCLREPHPITTKKKQKNGLINGISKKKVRKTRKDFFL
jgi:hypothetical protein